MKTIFQVNGQPFFPLGGQSTNSGPQSPEESTTFWNTLAALHGNTGLIPLYWESIEPQEGAFDFSSIDATVAIARERGFKVIFLWFGTWKNGNMQYVPDWVKLNPARFQRLTSPDGSLLHSMSPHCKATFDADCAAFRAVMTHIRAIDPQAETVIAMQVQNEAGLIGRHSRDYSVPADEDFRQPVPAELIEGLRSRPESQIYAIWQAAGGAGEGSWTEVFGYDGDEVFTAWHLSKFIDGVAAAGKAIHPIPMLLNVWLDSWGFGLPGVNYLPGSAVPKMIDLWKISAPHIDAIAPDLYLGSPEVYREYCRYYARDDNPLFVPESDSRLCLRNELNMFYAIGEFNAIGYCIFGLENMVVDDNGTPKEENIGHFGSYHALAAALPLLIKYHGTGRIHAVVQEEMMSQKRLDLGDYRGLVNFGFSRPTKTDFHHRRPETRSERGRGLVIQGEPNEFFVLGGWFMLNLQKKGKRVYQVESMPTSYSTYLSVEEGHFDSEGNWVCDRQRNGDERDDGIWVYPDVGIVRVVMFE